ncbi:WD40 repeat-like protein [Imleria badia]|nr:WD40 repeat-like protein [Imleria badia]
MAGVIPRRSDNDGPRLQLVISPPDKFISAVTYLPDGRRVVTGSDKTVRVWNLETGEQEGTSMEHEGVVICLATTRDGTEIITGNTNGIKVWDIESHKLVKEWTHRESCSHIAISPDNQLVAIGNSTVAIYTMDSEGRQVNHSIEVGKSVGSMSFSPDGKKLACGTYNDTRVYDVDSGTLVLGPLKFYKDYGCFVLWSRDGSRLFSASSKTIRCWNSDTAEQIGQPWTGHTRHILSLSLSPDGSILASASLDKTVRFWDTTSGHPIAQHLQHDGGVGAVHFSPSGEFVASTVWDEKTYLWRAPWLTSAENTMTSLANPDSDAPSNTVQCPQVYFFPPPPHSIHIPTVEQMSDLDLGLFTTAHPITSSVVLNSHPSLPTNPDEIDSEEPPSMSDLQSILPDPSFGFDERQRIFELRIRKLLDLAASNGLRVPVHLVPSTLPVSVRNMLSTGPESIPDVNQSSVSVCPLIITESLAIGQSARII